MFRRKQNRNKRASATAAAAAAATIMAGPPPLVMSPRVGDVLRFQVSSTLSSAVDITWACLRNIYFTTITASTASSIVKALKLRKVEAWTPITGATTGGAIAAPLTVRFREGDGMIGQEKTVSDVVTTSAGAHIKTKFDPLRTDTGKWHLASAITSSDIAFTIINALAGTVFDIHLSWQGWASGSDVASLTCGALSVGRIYRNVLDNTDAAGAIGGAILLPIGVVGSTGIAFG